MKSATSSIQHISVTSTSEVPQTFIKEHRRRITRGPVADYWELTKPEISFLVVLSALAGFLMGSRELGYIDGWRLLHTLVGTAFTAAGSGILNHVIERNLDALMKRTASRPLPAGRLNPRIANAIGWLLSAAGVLYLALLVNTLAALLALGTVLLYLWVYTPAKRKTTYNTLIGCIPGALPALGGWAAATGNIDLGGWTLYAILFFWQMPHFLSLAWMYRKDYARAGFKMIPVLDPGGRTTAYQTLFFTLLLIGASMTPVILGIAGIVYLIGALLLGAYMLQPVIRFYRTRSNQDARKVLLASIVYIPALLGIIFLDLLLDKWISL